MNNKIYAFVFTFITYAGFHVLRESWSFSKTLIQQEL